LWIIIFKILIIKFLPISDLFVIFLQICANFLTRWSFPRFFCLFSFQIPCLSVKMCLTRILYGTNLFALSPVNKISIDGGFIVLRWWWNMLHPKGWIRLRALVWMKTLLALLQFFSIKSISWWAEIPSKSPISCKWTFSLFRWVETLKLDAMMPLFPKTDLGDREGRYLFQKTDFFISFPIHLLYWLVINIINF